MWSHVYVRESQKKTERGKGEEKKREEQSGEERRETK